MNIYVTGFARHRHFEDQRSGTFITDRTPDKFQDELNKISPLSEHKSPAFRKVLPGYAPFCKLWFYKNWTDAKCGAIEIHSGNEQFLRTGFQARNDNELAVLCRWFEEVDTRLAEYLCIVVYSAEQLAKEGTKLPEGFDWGVVAILGQSHDNEEPMPPSAMIRNALGTEEGGSGVTLDRAAYDRSVEFWSRHATVKTGDKK